MIDTQYSVIASANRNRTNVAANREQVADRLAREKRTSNVQDAAKRRKDFANESALRQERAVQASRSDQDRISAASRSRAEQVRYSDTVAFNDAFQTQQSEVVGELTRQRADQAAAKDATLNQVDAALARDEIRTASVADPTAQVTNTEPSFSTFLAERESRVADRSVSERDRNVQQQIDLQIAENNLRTAPQGNSLPRGALVDILG